MNKKDLKTGMAVNFANNPNELYLVLLETSFGDILVNKNNFMLLSRYDENLRCSENNKRSKDFDIVRVFAPNYVYEMEFKRLTDQKLIWEDYDDKTIIIDGIEYGKATLRSIIKNNK